MVNEIFLNQTGTVGIIFQSFTSNVTGSEFLTLLLVTLLILAFFFMFRIPIEATTVLMLPIFLIYMSFSSNFMALGGVVIIYLGIIIAKNFII